MFKTEARKSDNHPYFSQLPLKFAGQLWHMKKGLTISLFLTLTGFLVYCGNPQKQTNTPRRSKSVNLGKETYNQYCVLCHGKDGSLQFNGAKDIRESELSLEERIVLIKDGKNTMTPFADVLTLKEIKAVAKFSMTLKK